MKSTHASLKKIFLKSHRKIIRTYEFRDLKIRGRLRGRDLT